MVHVDMLGNFGSKIKGPVVKFEVKTLNYE
jgi:hypothetical protein